MGGVGGVGAGGSGWEGESEAVGLGTRNRHENAGKKEKTCILGGGLQLERVVHQFSPR